MGRIRLGARPIVAAGLAASTAGVWEMEGRPAALIVGGVLTVLFGLLLVDVDKADK